MTDQENKALYIAQECRKAGMTLAGAAGVIASVEAESAFIPTNVQDVFEGRVGNDAIYTTKVDNGSYQNFAGDAAGYGLAQWTAADRKEGLLQFARDQGKSIGDFKMQVAYLIKEMKKYTRAWRTCCMSNDPYECGYDVCKYYEIPADKEAQAKYRGERAKKKWYPFLQFTDRQDATPDEPEENPAAAETKKLETWPPRTVDFHCFGFPEIRLVQTLLYCHGYHVLMDGVWTANVTKHLMEFQEANELEADGVCGKLTYIKLGINPAVFEGR